jgi:adenylate kinase
MRLILIGPQGSGKGTQAKIISKMFGIPHICSGDLLRECEGELKEEIDSYMKQGNLVPIDLLGSILRERLSKNDCNKGFVLDGFPRNMEQAKMLDEIVEIDKAIEISISDEEAIKRLEGRVACEKCGTGFNNFTMPPKVKGKCDRCGGRLTQREDDKEKAIRKRLEIYHKETEKLLEHYNGVKINGEQRINKVSKDIFRELENKSNSS